MNVERRSSRKKRETVKVKEAKDELLKKQNKKDVSDKSPSKKSDKKNNNSPISLDDDITMISPEVINIADVKDPSVSLDEVTIVDQESPGDNKKFPDTGSFTSAFAHNTLEELFNFLYDNKKSIIGQGDLKPEDFDHYLEDPVKEENSIFLGEKFSVSKTRTYYEAMLIDGVQYRIFDNVILSFDPKSQNLKPNVAKIIAFYEENSRKKVTLEWYYIPSDMLPTMERIRLTGRHPLIPVSDDSYEIDPTNSTKKKRGRPPNKRLFNVEETIKTLEEASEYEIFTSLKPYVDDINVSAIGEKCIVEHLQPTSPVPSQDKAIKTFFYKRTLEFKICALTFCKPRPNKPRQWIEILEKKNRDIKSHYSSRKGGDLMSPKINGYEHKKKKRKVEKIPSDDTIYDNHVNDDVNDDEINLFDYSDDTDILTSPPHNELNESIDLPHSTIHNKHLCSQSLGQKMEMIGNTITKRLEQIEKMIEIMNTDVQMSLEEIKTALMESKKDMSSNFQVSEANVLPDEFINLGGSSYQDSVFINQQFL